MKSWSLRLVVLAALILATLGITRAGRAQVESSPQRKVNSLPALPFLEVVALGYREAAADLAWMQAVQYYGEHRQGGNDLSEFGHFLEAVNTLDPRYEHAYVLGAFVLATDANDLDAALALLRRGSRALPESYRIPFEMAFLTYVMGGDADAAARYFGFAALKPGGRERALRFQAFLNRKLGRLETAWALWNDLYRTTENPSLRIVAQEALEKIEAALRARPAHGAASPNAEALETGEGS
jgi:hypothetical protein